MNKTIPWWQPRLGSQEEEFLHQVLKSHFPNEGIFTEKFEQKLSELLGVEHVVCVTNGTVALFLSLTALGIGPGDEVLVPDVTFIATANAVSLAGAKPVLVDIDPKTLTISTGAIERAITTRTKAIIPVHVSGRAADLSKILEIAKNHKLFVVEDAAEAFCSKYKGKALGGFGDTGCFSFSPHKMITTGQGGAIATNQKEIFLRLRELKDQGRPERGTGGDDVHHSIGYNFKFTNLQAALGLGQLTELESRLNRLQEIYLRYQKNLQGISGFSLLPFHIDQGERPLWVDAMVENRDALDQYLLEKEIHCRRFWFPLHTQKPYHQADKDFPNSTTLMTKALWLPSAFMLENEQIDQVCDEIQKFLKGKF